MEQGELREQQGRRSLRDLEQRKQEALGTKNEPRGKKSCLDWAVSQREAETEQRAS